MCPSFQKFEIFEKLNIKKDSQYFVLSLNFNEFYKKLLGIETDTNVLLAAKVYD